MTAPDPKQVSIDEPGIDGKTHRKHPKLESRQVPLRRVTILKVFFMVVPGGKYCESDM